MSAYELRRYTVSGQLELTVTRDDQFAYLPRPFQQVKSLGGGRAQVSFDNDRAFTTNLDVDPEGNVWYFTRDVPQKRTVIDVYSPAGVYLYNYEFPNTDSPSRLDGSGQLYAVTADGAYSQIIRYRVHRTCN
jgi:hypothetical protein